MIEYKRLPKIDVYKDSKDEWRWRVTASNGQIIGASTEGYENKKDCIQNMNNLGKQLANYTDFDSDL